MDFCKNTWRPIWSCAEMSLICSSCFLCSLFISSKFCCSKRLAEDWCRKPVQYCWVVPVPNPAVGHPLGRVLHQFIFNFRFYIVFILWAGTIAISRSFCKVFMQLGPLFFRKRGAQCTLVNLSSLSTGLLPFTLGPTAKAGNVRVKLGHKISTSAPFLIRWCLHHDISMIYTLLEKKYVNLNCLPPV